MRAGDAGAFQLLYRRHQAGLYRFALLHSGAPEVAADVVQEVFMGLLNESYKFDPLRGMLGHFLFGVARKLVLKQMSGRSRWSALDEGVVGDGDEYAEGDEADGADEPLARLLNNEAAEQLRGALMKLAPHHREVVILYELHELSYVEIAAICQVDLGTVRSRLSRARASLLRLLAPYQAGQRQAG